MGTLSAQSKCSTFDADADGYGRGEGFAIVYLKTLSKAVEDGDSIQAVIRGTAVNACVIPFLMPANFRAPHRPVLIESIEMDGPAA